MAEKSVQTGALSEEELQDLVASSDAGARNPAGAVGMLLAIVAVAWSIFQVIYASPMANYILPGSISNNSRLVHLAFAMFLAFMAYPATKSSPRNYVPIQDWLMALAGTFISLYGFFFYQKIVNSGGLADDVDKWFALAGLVLLFEAARRALGPAMALLATVFLAYVFFGSSDLVPDVIRWKGASLKKAMSHMWITSEGVFGIALGVSTKFVFLFVLFGALLDKAGAGNYFIKMAFGALGHLRGGPAKAAVVGSAATGLISGSSIANVVTTGTFTIPLMKRVGFSSEKAGAVEVASSVNGQIMPPVMGAAAFLMVEFTETPYVQVITHAFLPAAISYIALVYIVHLEAVKNKMPTLGDRDVTLIRTIAGMFGFFAVFAGLCYGSQFPVDMVERWVPSIAGLVMFGVLMAIYVALLRLAASVPDLEPDDPNAEEVVLPNVAEIYKAGLHYLLPIVVLVYFLMIERKSPGLSAFWATALLIFILLTQRPLKAIFRGENDAANAIKAGACDLWNGLIDGSRNMIGIALATATAGVIVGTVTLTGIGQVMADLVESMAYGMTYLAAGVVHLISPLTNLIGLTSFEGTIAERAADMTGTTLVFVLMCVGLLSLVLGMGLPTTANYIVVSSLMVGVVVELGAQSGLIVPLIAVHLFVFYFGIMADVTPPVGLASFAAAAVSGGDAIKTGFVAFFYSLRTVALPFVFIFNTDLLLIDVTWQQGILVFVISSIAILMFTAGTMGYWLTKSRKWESIALVLIAFALFRPDYLMERISPSTLDLPPAALETALAVAKPGQSVRVVVEGPDYDTSAPKSTTLLAEVDEKTGADRMAHFGFMVMEENGVMKMDEPMFGTPFATTMSGFDFYGDTPVVIKTVTVPLEQPAKEWLFIPVLMLLGLIGALQLGRARKKGELA